MDILAWRDLEDMARAAADEFGFHLEGVAPITNLRDKNFGYARRSGWIEMRLHWRRCPGRPLRWTTIVDTLAEELAHLGTWDEHRSHGPRWRDLRRRIKRFLIDRQSGANETPIVSNGEV